jgi:hypothetical protein
MKIIDSPDRRSYLARVGILLVVVSIISGIIGCEDGGYTPPSEDLEIRDWYDLDDVRDNLAGKHTLMNDLDSTTAGYRNLASPIANGRRGWEPIGGAQDAFTGSLDGRGYEIRDLYINRSDEYSERVGLFGQLGHGGVVENVGVVNVTVICYSYVDALVEARERSARNRPLGIGLGNGAAVGGLVGLSEGTVTNSYSSGSVTGDWMVGGLVGMNDDGTVSNSYSTGSVTGGWDIGGLVGDNFGTVSNSYSTSEVAGDWMVGGLVGLGDAVNCYSTGNVTGEERVGGLVGFGGAVNSYSTGEVAGNQMVGGLVGYGSGPVSDSYSTGSVTGYKDVGGLVGWNTGTVSNSHYNYDEVLINGQNIITVGALFNEDFEQWLVNDKFLDVNERLSQQNGYHVVNNVTDFRELLAFGQDASLKFRLNDHLDLAVQPNFYIPYLAGEFDGNGHKVWNMSFNFDFISPVGLFGCLAPSGELTGVGAENVNTTGHVAVGGLVGWNAGNLSNSYATGSVTGDAQVGGLVGWNDYSIGFGPNSSNVSNSYSSTSVTGNKYVGGLVGKNRGDVTKSYSTGSVTGTEVVGGLVGDNYGSVGNSYSTSLVAGDDVYVGGLVGFSGYSGAVSGSFWDTETSGTHISAGGWGKTTAEMQDIATFSGAGWNIIAVANPVTRNPSYIWNIVDDETYPFLSWES